MAGFSNNVEAKVLDHICGDGAYTSPSPYLALLTALPTDTDTAGSLSEATYTGYVRLALSPSDMSAASGGSKTNSATLTFAACTASTSTIVAIALVSSSSGAGDLIMYGAVPTVVVSTTQTPPTIAPGGLVLTLD